MNCGGGWVLQEADKKKKQEEKAAKEAAKGPKRGLSAYMYYTADVRPKFREENPDAKMGDLAKLMGATWKTLSKEDKTPYEEKAKGSQARYEKEKKEWEADMEQDQAEASAEFLDVLHAAEDGTLRRPPTALPYALERKLEFCKTFYLKKDAKQKQKVALEAAAKLDPGGDSSWFVKVLADAKQIEAMAAVR